MAETAIAAALSKFGELAASEAKVLLEAGDNMTLLRDRLEWLQAFIRDADRRRRAGTDDQLTRVWVRQTRHVAFQAEDTIDEFVYQVDLKSQGYRRWKKMWRKYLTGFCTQIVSRHTLSARINRINTRLAKNQKEYNIGHTPLAAPVTSSTTATSAWLNNAEPGPLWTELIQFLYGGEPKRQTFISILGESGIGKMTLVSTVFPEVVDLFPVTCSLLLAADATVDVNLEKIYDALTTGNGRSAVLLDQPKEEGIYDTTDKIRHYLMGKKYLVIISGISSKTMLNCLRASLPDNNNGSRVLLLLDTENEEVAWHADTMNQEKGGLHVDFKGKGVYMLSRWDEETSVRVFCSRIVRRDDPLSEDVEMIMNKYRKIVYDITGGYPLAIVVLAGLLRFKERPRQWEAVLQQLRPADVQGGSGSGEGNQQIIEGSVQSTRTTTIERVFWASFEDLPNDLKSCFLYFIAQPKETFWGADNIVRMWIAEGFIKPQKGKTMEEIGHNYLKELVVRCLVRGIDEVYDDEVYVHKRLHGFLQSEAREAGFMEVHDMHHVFVPPSVRRLSFTTLGGRYTPFANRFPKLRTYICWVMEKEQQQHQSYGGNQEVSKKKHWHDLEFLCGSKFLRVIRIEGMRIKVLPDKMGDMIHLRYLGVVNCQDLKELPSSIKRLLNLQTLDIRNTLVDMIDPGFWKIRTLRHVLADKLTLPETIDEELTELQTLSGVKPAADQGGEWKGQQECPLHKMPNLRTLKLHGIEHQKHGLELKSALVKMHLLGDLSLQGDVIPSCVFTAPSLRFLQTVKLNGTVDWPEVGWDASKVRPNLINVKVTNCDNGVPQHMQKEFDKISTNAAQGEVEE